MKVPFSPDLSNNKSPEKKIRRKVSKAEALEEFPWAGAGNQSHRGSNLRKKWGSLSY